MACLARRDVASSNGNRMIIFLDFDGVLHPEPCRLGGEFCHLPRFENVLRDLPAVRIVVSSSWRHTRNLATLKSYFSPDISSRIIGVTPSSKQLDGDIPSYERQAEVEAWLRKNASPWDAFVVLDDRPWLFSPFYAPLVKCVRAIGLDDRAEYQLRERLAHSVP